MFKKYAVLTVMFVAGLFVTNGAYADTTANTGNAQADIEVTTEAGMNKLDLGGLSVGSTDVEIADNGKFSENNVVVNNNNNITVNQTNNTTVNNNIQVDLNTGDVAASGNRRGDVDVRTGDATANVKVETKAGLNVLNMGCDNCDNSTRVEVSDNGAFSENSVRITNDNDLEVNQDNDTDVNNDVEVNLNTGGLSVFGDYGKRDHKYSDRDQKGSDHDKDKYDREYKKDQDYKKSYDWKKDSDRTKDYDKGHNDKKDNRYMPYRLNHFDGYRHWDKKDKSHDFDKNYEKKDRDWKYDQKKHQDKYDYDHKKDRDYNFSKHRQDKDNRYWPYRFYKIDYHDFEKKDHERKGDHDQKYCDCERDRKSSDYYKNKDGKYTPYKYMKFDHQKSEKHDRKYDYDKDTYRDHKNGKYDRYSHSKDKKYYPVLFVKSYENNHMSPCYQSKYDRGNFRKYNKSGKFDDRNQYKLGKHNYWSDSYPGYKYGFLHI